MHLPQCAVCTCHRLDRKKKKTFSATGWIEKRKKLAPSQVGLDATWCNSIQHPPPTLGHEGIPLSEKKDGFPKSLLH